MKRFVLLSLSFSLAGCLMMRPYPPQPEPYWYKEGATARDASTKLAKCKYDVGMNKVDPSGEISLIHSCMIADGFRWQVYPEDKKAWQEKVDALQKQGYQLY
ncbi:Uncharacterised protein [Canicola haemoglobinophilus]|uniref:Lipoprotein n=1 Tax=Canicola haemoglobinophilus TaxID=733 RepID=A0AB38HCM6_9PAST|nr:hypothetical protein [Canicola haemoglobinophilus]STO54710.1 Uncharacterised protein [Canicola haemoglobinophilus]STO69718.1 Uncharacterised protein [Canicola haemoglobinophilus]